MKVAQLFLADIGRDINPVIKLVDAIIANGR